MLISRDKIEKEVTIALQHYNTNRKIKEKIISQFEKRGFLYGEINAIFTGTNPLMQVSDELFYLLIIFLYNNIDDESMKVKINPDKILTEIEKEIANNLIIDRSKESIYPIVIENVNMDMEDDYSTVFTLEQLSELFDKRIIKYNPQTQRPLISKYYGGKEVKEIFINEKNRKAITKNILENKQIPDEITFNVLANGEEHFEYDKANRRLIIYEGAFDCSDGWHRTVSGVDAYRQKPTLTFAYKGRITHWDLDKTKAFIHQKSLGTQLDPLAKKTYDVYNPANQIVTKLNEHPKSNIKGKITTDTSDINNDKALVMFDVLFDSIQHTFEIKDNSDVVKVSNYLREGINLISENDIAILEERQSDQIWTVYIIVLAKYYQQENWKNKVMETIDSIDKNEVQSIEYKKINKPFIKRINDYIDSLA